MHDRYKQNRVHIFAPCAERKHLKAHCGPRHGAGPRRHRLFGRYRARRAVFPRRGANCRAHHVLFRCGGLTYTSNLKKYLLRLFIAAVISHVPYALCFKFTVWEFWYVTGVLWGLFLGLLAVTLWKQLCAPVWVRLLLLGLCCLLAYPANWNYIAVLWIFGFAVFRESPKKQWSFFGLVTLLYVLQYFVYGSTLPVWLRPFVLLCVPLLLCYNHTLGRRSKVLQWGYYLFYPAHLLVLTLLREIFTRL